MFNTKNFADEIATSVRNAQIGSGGLAEHTVIHRGKRFLLVESSIIVKTHDGRWLHSESHNSREASRLSILFATRGSKGEAHVDFVILNSEDEICATSQDVERLFCFAGFCEQGQKRTFGLCVLAANDGSTHQSNVLVTEEPRAMQFMRTMAAFAGGLQDA